MILLSITCLYLSRPDAVLNFRYFIKRNLTAIVCVAPAISLLYMRKLRLSHFCKIKYRFF